MNFIVNESSFISMEFGSKPIFPDSPESHAIGLISKLLDFRIGTS
jgi:hypothetical protein